MPRVSKLSLQPIDWGKVTFGHRVARIRKERGRFTQVQFADKIGIVQTLVTDYENDRLRITAEIAVRFAMALDVSLDELLHPKVSRPLASRAAKCCAAWNRSRRSRLLNKQLCSARSIHFSKSTR